MGLLNQKVEDEYIPAIGQEFSVAVGVSHSDLHWPEIERHGFDGSTIGHHIENRIMEIRSYNDDQMKEQIEIVVRIMLGQYFTRKHSNGLYKKFTFEWSKDGNTTICQVRDDLRNSHLKIILKPKQYGFLQNISASLSKMAQFLRGTAS